MRRWYVVTPEYETKVPILDDGSGPVEYGCDVVEVEAETRRDAITFGVKIMLAGSDRDQSFAYTQTYRLSPAACLQFA